MVITPAPAGQGAMIGGDGGAMFASGGGGGEQHMRENYVVQMMMMMGGGGGGNSNSNSNSSSSRRRRRSRLSSSPGPCAACKLLRRKCRVGECVFAPYFPPEEPHKFASVHKVFGASNVSKLLLQLSPSERSDAVSTLVFEAEARIQDPVYGCVAAISLLQRHLLHLQQQLALVHAHLLRHRPSQGNNQYVSSNQQPPSAAGAAAAAAGLASHLSISRPEDLYCSNYTNALLLDSATSAASGPPQFLNHHPQQHQQPEQQQQQQLRRHENKILSALDLQAPPSTPPRRRHYHAEAYHPYSRLPSATTNKRQAGGLTRDHNFLLDCNINPHLQAQQLCRSGDAAEAGPNLLCSAYTNHLQLFDPSAYNLDACHDNPALSHDELSHLHHDVCDVAAGNSTASPPMQAELLQSEKNHLVGGGGADTDQEDVIRLENLCQPRQSSFSSAASSTTSTTSASMHELMMMQQQQQQQLVNGSSHSSNITTHDPKPKLYVDNHNSRILDMLRNEASCVSIHNVNIGDGGSNVILQQQEDCVCTSMAASLMMMQDPVMMSRSSYSYHTNIA